MMEGKLIKEDEEYYLEDSLGVTIASTDKILLKETDTVKKLSLKNCQAIENGYDLDELFESIPIGSTDENGRWKLRAGFITGFQKAVEILGEKKFSKEDLLKGIDKGIEIGSSNCKWDLKRYDYIQSLHQTEWDVEIEMDFAIYPANLPKEGEERPAMIPKLDADGCLILKRKTICG